MNISSYYHLSVLFVTFIVTGCFSNPPEVFDENKSKQLTTEQRAKMDVDFFNVFVVRTTSIEDWESEKGSPRGDIVRNLAEQGFEVAWLAERFYHFHHVGYRKVKHGEVYWNRLKELADNGDASAQCFMALSVKELSRNSNYKPPKTDVEMQTVYMEKAVEQQHPECLGSSGFKFQTGSNAFNHAKNNLLASEKGCAYCQARISSFYARGKGIEQDYSKALCWAHEATLNSDSPNYSYEYRVLKSRISHDSKIRNIIGYKPKTNCKEQY